ncbi:MBL fold metallo-hydrolase [Nocardiopsis sp. CNT-189]|uniref:MBL fold metallo-hydrolase n=1 Tax=Nocardiopsis oceanisediminis TaxID=2816862 RepID=UPI003B3716B1
MRIHHFSTGSMLTIDPTYEGPGPARAVCHTLLLETDASGLVLVETGLGLNDVRDPDGSLGREWVEFTRPVLDPEETAVRRVAALGHDPADVRHIVLTHLDLDHAGGLPDFPHAAVHVMAEELRAARAEAPSRRYRPGHWAHGPHWTTYRADGGEDWFGLPGARELDGLPPDVLLVPLPGHTAGHAGVAVRDGGRWLLHAGDAYYYHRELDPDAPHGHPLMDLVQLDSQVDEAARSATQEALRALRREHGDRVDVVCAHDPWDLRRLERAGSAG